MHDHAIVAAGIQFTDSCPDGAERAAYRVLSVPGKTPWVGWFISDRVFGTYDHHVSGKTRPCPGHGNCQWCGTIERNWHGYAAFQFVKSNRVAVARLLPNIAQQLKRMHPHGESIRGLQVRLYRTNGKDNGPMGMDVFPGRHDGIGLHPSFDLVDYMLNVWREVLPRYDHDAPESLSEHHSDLQADKGEHRSEQKRVDDPVAQLASALTIHGRESRKGRKGA